MRKTLFSLLLLVICCALLNVVSSGLLLLGTAFFSPEVSLSDLISDPTGFSPGKLSLGLVHLMTFVGGTLLWYRLRTYRWQDFTTFFKLDKEPAPRLTLTSVSIILLLLPIMGLIVHGMSALDLPDFVDDWDQDQTELLQGILRMDGLGDLLLLVVVVALLPAIGEELVFRGVLQQKLIRVIGVTGGIVLSSIIFSAIHLQIMGFLPKLLIGLALGFVFHRTQHLYFPMLMHFVNNALPLLGLYMAGGQLPDDQAVADTAWTQLLPSALISIALLIFVIRYLIRITPVDEPQP
jgi:membrane protease YdiL (CAAX protease family)